MGTLLFLAAVCTVSGFALVAALFASYFVVRYFFVIVAILLVYGIVTAPFTVNPDIITAKVDTKLAYRFSEKTIYVQGEFANFSKYSVRGVYVECRIQRNAYGDSSKYNQYIHIGNSKGFSGTITKVDISMNRNYPSPILFCRVSDYFH